MLLIRLDAGIAKLTPDETLGVKDCVGRVYGRLGFGRVANKTLSFRECYIGWRGAVALDVE
jgi:hypothetical protein